MGVGSPLTREAGRRKIVLLKSTVFFRNLCPPDSVRCSARLSNNILDPICSHNGIINRVLSVSMREA